MLRYDNVASVLTCSVYLLRKHYSLTKLAFQIGVSRPVFPHGTDSTYCKVSLRFHERALTYRYGFPDAKEFVFTGPWVDLVRGEKDGSPPSAMHLEFVCARVCVQGVCV